MDTRQMPVEENLSGTLKAQPSKVLAALFAATKAGIGEAPRN